MGGDCKPRGDRAGTFEPTYRIDEKSFGWFDQSRHNFDLATLLDSGVHSVLHLQSPRFDALFHHFDEAFLL